MKLSQRLHALARRTAALIVLYVAAIEGVIQVAFGRMRVLDVGFGDAPIPIEIALLGLVIGSLYAMVGMGLILVYRANGIINFAQAQLGAVPAVIALLLVARGRLPYLAVLPIVVLGGPLLGAGAEVSLIRRFTNAPRLILTVATIGLGYLLLVAEFFSKKWIAGDLTNAITLRYPTPFGSQSWRIGVVTFTGDHVMAVLVSGAAMVALAAFFRFTDIGIAVRAAADNGERAGLLGIPVRRVSTIVWSLAALLSAVGIFFRAPLVGLPLNGFVGPSILLTGLAVAVMAGMTNLPRALAAGMLVGIAEQMIVFATARPSIVDGVMCILILAALLGHRGGLSRARDIGASTWQAVREVRPVPVELRNVPVVRWARAVLGAAAVIAATLVPFIVGDGSTPEATLVVIYAMIGVSLVVLTGWAGQISLGQYAIAGVSAATAGGLAANHHWDFFATILAGSLTGAVVAVLVGLPALRVQGLFLAVTSLAFAFAVQGLLSRDYVSWLLPADGQLVRRPVLWGLLDLNATSTVGGIELTADAKFYYVCLLFLLAVLGCAHSLRNNRSGRIFISVRDNGRMAQAFGIGLARTRLAAFAVSGTIAGLAGALLAYQNQAIAAQAFTPEISIEVFILTVIGGVGSLLGALLGAVYVRGLPLLPGLRDIDQVTLLTSGVGLLLLLQFLPGGLAEAAYRVRDRWLRRVAESKGIRVPSLLEDSAARATPDDLLLDDVRSVPRELVRSS